MNEQTKDENVLKYRCNMRPNIVFIGYAPNAQDRIDEIRITRGVLIEIDGMVLFWILDWTERQWDK
jgi:hypothetical protein